MNSLTYIPQNYIVRNMSATSAVSRQKRTERVDYVAEHLLSRAALLVRLLVKQVHSREISRTEVEVLSILSDSPRRITELSELEGVAQPTMTLLVRRLEEKGWVKRGGLPDDGRVVLISVTETGRAAQLKFRAQFLAALRADLQRLTDQQLQELAAAAQTLSAFVDELQQRTGR